MLDNGPSPQVIRFGVFEVDLRSRELRKQGRRIPIQDKPFEVLASLIERPGVIVTREELRARLWPGDTFVVFDDNVNAAIKKVRDALGDAADRARFIETVPRRGYKFIAGVDGHAPNGQPVAAPVAVEPPVAEPPPPANRSGLTPRLLAAAALVATGALAGAGLVVSLRPSDRTVVTPRIRQLTMSGSDSEPSASPDGKSIAFSSRRDGVSRIWWKLLAGGGEAPLTRGPDHGPRFFPPDGSSLLFLRNDGATDAVWRVPIVGGTEQLIVRDVVTAEPSPDGLEIAFVRAGLEGRRRATVLGLANSTGGNERELYTFHDQELTSIRWTPDGKTIAGVRRATVGAETALVFVDVASKAVKEVPSDSGSGAYGALAFVGDGSRALVTRSEDAQVYMPGALGRLLLHDVATKEQQVLQFLPDLFGLFRSVESNGRVDVVGDGQVVYHSVQIRQNLREVHPGDAGTTDEGRIGTFGLSQDRQPAYSPDGQSIVFSSNRSGNLDLWLLSRNAAEPTQLTDHPAHDRDPALAPDGQHVFWTSRRSGNLEVWTMRLDGTGLRQVTRDGVDAQNPTIGRDAQWVVYASANLEKAGIWRIRPNGADASRIVAGSGDLPLTLPEISPSGQYALYRQDDRLRRRSTIRVVDVHTAREVPFEIVVPYNLHERAMNILWGRARWTPDGQAIAFIAQDSDGRASVYQQQFSPDRDTSASRRRLESSLPRSTIESFGISPDGKSIIVSDGFSSQSVMLVEGLVGIEPPRRRVR